MPSLQHEHWLASLQEEVETAREAFDVAKEALYRDIRTVHDVGYTNPDGTSLWQRSIARYNRAVELYGDALHRLANALADAVPASGTARPAPPVKASSISVGRYRLRAPTIALENKDGRPISIRLPEGSTVIVEERPGDAQFVECTWDSVQVRLFTVDLLNRGERC